MDRTRLRIALVGCSRRNNIVEEAPSRRRVRGGFFHFRARRERWSISLGSLVFPKHRVFGRPAVVLVFIAGSVLARDGRCCWRCVPSGYFSECTRPERESGREHAVEGDSEMDDLASGNKLNFLYDSRGL